jgi:hypothetical protein
VARHLSFSREINVGIDGWIERDLRVRERKRESNSCMYERKIEKGERER